MKYLTIEITDKCTLNCSHCSTNAINQGSKFLTIQKIENILAEFSDFDVVRLSGGEPFEHPMIREILKTIKQKNKQAWILSSGVKGGKAIPKELLNETKKFIDMIVFSIYGCEEIHNKVCNSNSYELLKKSVESVIEEKIPFFFQTVAMKTNFNDLENILKYLKNIKSRINYCIPQLNMLRFIKQGRAKENQELALTNEQIKSLIEDCKILFEKYGVEIIVGCSLQEKTCTQGSGKAAITIQGEKISCSALKYGSKQERFACRDRW